MLDPRLVQISSKDQVFSNQWFQLLDRRMKQNTYWTFSSRPLFVIAAILYILYNGLQMPVGYYMAANWLFLSGCLSWYINRKDIRAKVWKLLVEDSSSYSFSLVKTQLAHDRLPLMHSLFYGAIIGISLFLFYQGADIVGNAWSMELWLVLILSLAIGQASGFLQRYVYNAGIETDLKLLEEIEARIQSQPV